MKHITPLLLVACLITLAGFRIAGDPEERLTTISREYVAYARSYDSKTVMTDSARYKWTVSLCAYLGEETMGFYRHRDSTFFSRADAASSPHGDKLYRLFVKDASAYDYKSQAQPTGQTLVKETWNVIPVNSDSLADYSEVIQSRNDGKWYRPTTVSQLFIMYKEEVTATNDQGWVYGIVDLESGKSPKVLSKGSLSSCIACHRNTKYDRIFGR